MITGSSLWIDKYLIVYPAVDTTLTWEDETTKQVAGLHVYHYDEAKIEVQMFCSAALN